MLDIMVINKKFDTASVMMDTDIHFVGELHYWACNSIGTNLHWQCSDMLHLWFGKCIIAHFTFELSRLNFI